MARMFVKGVSRIRPLSWGFGGFSDGDGEVEEFRYLAAASVATPDPIL